MFINMPPVFPLPLFEGAILQEGKSLLSHLNLKSGSSDYPLVLLRKAGVDLITPEPVEKALHLFARLVTEMERVLIF